MNFSLLPDELLANIIGCLDSETVETILLLNKRFNSIVNRYSLYKPVADTIKFSSVGDEDIIKVTVTRPQKNGLQRKKEFSITCLKESGSVTLNDQLANELIPLRLHGTLVIDLTEIQNDNFDVFQICRKAAIRMDYLHSIITNELLEVLFVTKEFMDRLIARSPTYITFKNCKTALNSEEFYTYLVKNAGNTCGNAEWHFGIFNVSADSKRHVWRILTPMKLGHATASFTDKKNLVNQEVWNIPHGSIKWQDRIQ